MFGVGNIIRCRFQGWELPELRQNPLEAPFEILVTTCLPIGPYVVPVYGLDLEAYKITPKRNYLGADGYELVGEIQA